MTLTGCLHTWLIHLLLLAGGGYSKHGSSCTERVIMSGAQRVSQEGWSSRRQWRCRVWESSSLGCLSKPVGSWHPLSTLAEKWLGKGTGVSWLCRLREDFLSWPVSFSMKPSPIAVCIPDAALDDVGEFTAVNATALHKSICESE